MPDELDALDTLDELEELDIPSVFDEEAALELLELPSFFEDPLELDELPLFSRYPCELLEVDELCSLSPFPLNRLSDITKTMTAITTKTTAAIIRALLLKPL